MCSSIFVRGEIMYFQSSKLWVSLVLGNALLVAAGTAQSKPYQFDQVTVLGQAQETEIFKNPASVSVIDRATLDKSAGQSTAAAHTRCDLRASDHR